jgi:hypothetical protein
MRFELIELMIVMLSWMRDLPADLYPGAPPSVQIRGKPATDPLNRVYRNTRHSSWRSGVDPRYCIYLRGLKAIT